jgi:pimeloyl-ACP methyl ester carboxylesterase
MKSMPQRAAFVYLHGFASSPASQKARVLRERFAARKVRLEVPDLNEGEDGFRGLTIARMLRSAADAAARARREAGLAADAPSVLIGSSLGGYVAALLAAREPAAAVVLLAPAFDFVGRFASHFPFEDLETAAIRGYFEVYHYGLAAPAKVGYGLIDEGLRYEPFPDVTAPTLVVHGRRDQSVPSDLSERFCADRPAARLILLDDDHQMLASTERIWEETQAFLAAWM